MSSSLGEILAAAAMQWLVQLPMLLVYLTGLVLALVLRPRLPTASTLALVGLVILLVLLVVQPLFFQYLIRTQSSAGRSATDLRQAMTIVGVVTNLLHAGGFTLVLAAVFVGRPVPAAPAR
jgi:hypothetical protein